MSVEIPQEQLELLADVEQTAFDFLKADRQSLEAIMLLGRLAKKVEEYREWRRQARGKVLDELASESEEMGLY